MTRIVSLTMVFLYFSLAALTLSGRQNRVEDDGIRGHFVGAWRLVSLEAPGPDGNNSKGRLHRECSSSRATVTRRFR